MVHQLVNYIASNSDSIKVTDEIARKAVKHSEVVEEALYKRGIHFDEIEPLTEYSEYILNHGTYNERTKLIEGIKTTFALKNRQLTILDN